jgi:hypothetical protein
MTFLHEPGAIASAPRQIGLLADGDPAVARRIRDSCSSPRLIGIWNGRCSSEGFNYCYDKRLYDRILHGPAEQVRLHTAGRRSVSSTASYGSWRIMTSRGLCRHSVRLAREVAAVTALTQTGARLVHNGQLEGATVHLPVFLGRYPSEPTDPDLITFYRSFLTAAGRSDLPKRSLAALRAIRLAWRRQVSRSPRLVLAKATRGG